MRETTAPTRLLVARHGNTFRGGEVVRRVGITDLPLVESGINQGQRLGTYLELNQLVPDVIFTSQLKRTIQTANAAQEAMKTSIPMRALEMLNEIDYGIDENQPEEAVIERLGPGVLLAWEQKGVVPQGWQVDPNAVIQNWLDLGKIILESYAGKTVLIVTSNGIARFSGHLTGDFPAFSDGFGIKLATGALGLFEHEVSTSFWRCKYWNLRP